MNEIGTPVSRDTISREDESMNRSILDHGAAGITRKACRSGREHLAVRAGLSAVNALEAALSASRDTAAGIRSAGSAEAGLFEIQSHHITKGDDHVTG